MSQKDLLLLERARQRALIHHQLVFLAIFCTDWYTAEELQLLDSTRKDFCESSLYGIVGGPGALHSRLERMLNRNMDNILERLKSDFPDLRDDEYLVFCYSAAGLSNRLIHYLAHLSCDNAASVIKSRLRERIFNSESAYKEEYLALLPKKGCRFGEEMLYLHDSKDTTIWKL